MSQSIPRFIPFTLVFSLVLCNLLLASAVSAYTTEVTVRRFATDGITPINETTVTYQWMEANMDVYGDGNTYYYYQGPIYEAEWEANYGVLYPQYRTDWGGTPPAWTESEERWDRFWNGTGYEQNEEVNWQAKNLGKLKGTNVADLCDLVGGLPPGKEAQIIAVDNAEQSVPYSVLYTPTPQLGPYILTWYSVDAGESGSTNGYTGPDYTNGMRATFFADTSRNPSGAYVAGLGDQAEGLSPAYWYYYNGILPSMGGWTLKYVDRVYVYSNDPVPPPEADFTASIKSGRILNGNFETGSLAPWTGSGASIHTGTYKRGTAGVSLVAPYSGSAHIQQTVDLTGVGSISFWRRSYGATGKYLQVLIDDTVVANFTEATTITGSELVDLSSFSFSGLHTLTFRAVSTQTSQTFTVYLDDIEDYAPGTSGPAPLTVQFEDHSTKMEDAAHISWAWDFNNDGITDSTLRNPLYVFTDPGSYTVKLTATNAGGSGSEIKTDYITVVSGYVPIAAFSGTPTSGYAPLTVTFTDLSTNSPTEWSWNFGDGSTSSLQSPSHRYSSAGTYTVTLTATNSHGSDSETKTDYITVQRALDADFYGSVNTTTNGGFETGSLSGWTYNSLASVQTAQKHTGSYAAYLPTTQQNQMASISQTVDLTSVNQLSYFYHLTPSTTGTLKVYIDGIEKTNKTGSTSSWTADTIDTTSYSGTHTIRFEANHGLSGSQKAINAYLDDIVTLSHPSGSITRPAPFTVYFTDTSTNSPTSWSWDFGDAGTSTLRNPSHTYTGTGSYTVSLTATNAQGSDTETKIAYVVTGTAPTIDIDATGGIENWPFALGTNEDITSVDLSVSTTASSWHVAVRDALDGGKPAGTVGKMAEHTGTAYVTPSGKYLSNAIQVKSGTGSYVTLTGSDQTVQTGTSSGTFNYDIGLKQVIASGDPALSGSNKYHIVITFTGSTD
jgi:PKD repeat protein